MVNFFVFIKSFLFCFVVAIFDLVHSAKAIFHFSFLKYE